MERIEWKFCFTYIQHRVNQQEEYPINPIAQQSALVLMNTMKIVEPSDDQHYPLAKFRGRESPTHSYEFEGSPSWTGMYLHIILFSLIEPMLRAEDRRHFFTISQFFTGSINLKIMSLRDQSIREYIQYKYHMGCRMAQRWTTRLICDHTNPAHSIQNRRIFLDNINPKSYLSNQRTTIRSSRNTKRRSSICFTAMRAASVLLRTRKYFCLFL